MNVIESTSMQIEFVSYRVTTKINAIAFTPANVLKYYFSGWDQEIFKLYQRVHFDTHLHREEEQKNMFISRNFQKVKEKRKRKKKTLSSEPRWHFGKFSKV